MKVYVLSETQVVVDDYLRFTIAGVFANEEDATAQKNKYVEETNRYSGKSLYFFDVVEHEVIGRENNDY